MAGSVHSHPHAAAQDQISGDLVGSDPAPTAPQNGVSSAYKHAKALAASGDAAEVFTALGFEVADDDASGIVAGDAADVCDRFIEAIGKHRAWTRAGRTAVPA